MENSLIGKFLGKKFASDYMVRALRYKWRPVGDLEIISLWEGFIIFRFMNKEDLHRVRTKGPWLVGDWDENRRVKSPH